MCLGDWNSHGKESHWSEHGKELHWSEHGKESHWSEYYECYRYTENRNIANECSCAGKRSSDEVLVYFEHWENDAKSLQLKEQTLLKITSCINDKVMESEGTWIDWQY